MNSRAVKFAVSLLLTACLLCCSISVFATDPSPSPSIPPLDEGTGAIKEELLSRYIWMCLNAWGIQIKYSDMDEFYDEIESQIITWVIEYLATLPSAYTIDQWIAPWQAGYDYWGNLRLNNSALEDIQDFAQWLQVKLGLIDDDTVVINPVYTVNGTYTLYLYNNYYSASYTNGGSNYNDYLAIEFETNSSSITPIGYVVAQVETANGINYYMLGIASQSGLIRGLSNGIMANGVEESWGSYVVNCNTLNNYNYYTGYAGGVFHKDSTQGWFVPNQGTFYSGDYDEFTVFRQNLKIQEIGDLKVVTLDMVLPIDSPDYVDGDGITIVDGQPNYEVITFSGEVTNLPAIVSTGTIENPEIDQIYTNIPAFFQMAGDTMNGIKQILFRMPDEVLICLYAVLSIGVIFGFLRIMREH